MLQALRSDGDILDKAMSTHTNLSQGYKSHGDCSGFKDNSLSPVQDCFFLVHRSFSDGQALGNIQKLTQAMHHQDTRGNQHHSLFHSTCSGLQGQHQRLRLWQNSFHSHMKPRFSWQLWCVSWTVRSQRKKPSVILYVTADNAHSLGGFFESFQVC